MTDTTRIFIQSVSGIKPIMTINEEDDGYIIIDCKSGQFTGFDPKLGDEIHLTKYSLHVSKYSEGNQINCEVQLKSDISNGNKTFKKASRLFTYAIKKNDLCVPIYVKRFYDFSITKETDITSGPNDINLGLIDEEFCTLYFGIFLCNKDHIFSPDIVHPAYNIFELTFSVFKIVMVWTYITHRSNNSNEFLLPITDITDDTYGPFIADDFSLMRGFTDDECIKYFDSAIFDLYTRFIDRSDIPSLDRQIIYNIHALAMTSQPSRHGNISKSEIFNLLLLANLSSSYCDKYFRVVSDALMNGPLSCVTSFCPLNEVFDVSYIANPTLMSSESGSSMAFIPLESHDGRWFGASVDVSLLQSLIDRLSEIVSVSNDLQNAREIVHRYDDVSSLTIREISQTHSELSFRTSKNSTICVSIAKSELHKLTD